MKKYKPLKPVTIIETSLSPKESFCITCNSLLITIKEIPISTTLMKGTLREKGCPNNCTKVNTLQ